jgi:hypothetical protein
VWLKQHSHESVDMRISKRCFHGFINTKVMDQDVTTFFDGFHRSRSTLFAMGGTSIACFDELVQD